MKRTQNFHDSSRTLGSGGSIPVKQRVLQVSQTSSCTRTGGTGLWLVRPRDFQIPTNLPFQTVENVPNFNFVSPTVFERWPLEGLEYSTMQLIHPS